MPCWPALSSTIANMVANGAAHASQQRTTDERSAWRLMCLLLLAAWNAGRATERLALLVATEWACSLLASAMVFAVLITSKTGQATQCMHRHALAGVWGRQGWATRASAEKLLAARQHAAHSRRAP